MAERSRGRGYQEEPKGSAARAELCNSGLGHRHSEQRQQEAHAEAFLFLKCRYIYPLGLLKKQVSISGPK